MKSLFCLLTLLLPALAACGGKVQHDHSSWSKRVADSYLARHTAKDTLAVSAKWNYEQGLMCVALLELWQATGERKYFDAVRDEIDNFVKPDGTIRTYRMSDYNLDNVAGGRALLALFHETGLSKYKTAADTLRQQLAQQPRTRDGGFWHKQIYPYQMWLDGLYMAEPFYARYAGAFGPPAAFDDITAQFGKMSAHARDTLTGLYYHGWDERRQERWADPATGCSPSFWSRAMGWYAMALVDVLDALPEDHPRREELLTMFRQLAGAVLKVRDEQTKLWYQVADQGGRPGNYLEASASGMFCYSFAKGARMKYLDVKFYNAAEETFQGLLKNFVREDARGLVDLLGTCRSAGLGGSPYREGTYAYYVGEPQRTNDMKGIGAFLLAAVELERRPLHN